ncbi:hypothetical protein [Dokdonia sp. Asnod1-B02]|uniref:hypothetical protein n=1 Tax=Dokdonia sp. Asnod1-B02 TaxID=3160573 RepID=UPI003870DE8E
MDNYFEILFSPVNITLTILLSLLLVYWIFTMISGVDFDLDVDVDIDIDVDVDADIDLDSGLEGGNMDFSDVANAEVDRSHVVNRKRKPLKWWQVVLIYFNFVGLPFMFTFTFWIFIWWFCSLIVTSITGSYENTFGHLIVLAFMIPALFINKIITTPFKSFFKNLNKDGDKAVDFLGRQATLLSTVSGDKMGNAELQADGNTMSIYVKSLDGSELRFRESILIIKQSTDKNYFYVSKA